MEKEEATCDDYKKKKNVAVDPDGNETTYDSAYKASLELGIHTAVITCCCKGERYAKSGTSKNREKIYISI